MRKSCCIPFCKRTRPEDGKFKEWICQKHWNMVPVDIRKSYSAEKTQARRIIKRKPEYREYWKLKPGCSDRLAAVAMWRRLDTAWCDCRDQAIISAQWV